MRTRKYIIAAALIIATVSPCFGNEAKCREIARSAYPSDPKMQNYVYNKQISAARYMGTVTDQYVKRIALREYPSDFLMQKSVYDKQLSAKQFMAAMPIDSTKQRAIREYPQDYSMQKKAYEKLRRWR